MKVVDENRLALVVNDAAAVYPVRIDPTFSDEDWGSMGGLLGADEFVNAAVADGAGNLYIGGYFTVVGDVRANSIAKWDGGAWSALGSGTDGYVNALAVFGTDLHAGGDFISIGNRVSAYAARAKIGVSSVAAGRFGNLTYSPATGLRFTFLGGTPGQTYRIQSSPSMAPGSWSPLANFNYTAPIVITDDAVAGTPGKFYRAVTP